MNLHCLISWFLVVCRMMITFARPSSWTQRKCTSPSLRWKELLKGPTTWSWWDALKSGRRKPLGMDENKFSLFNWLPKGCCCSFNQKGIVVITALARVAPTSCSPGLRMLLGLQCPEMSASVFPAHGPKSNISSSRSTTPISSSRKRRTIPEWISSWPVSRAYSVTRLLKF